MNPTHSILDVIRDSKQAVLKLLTMEKYQQHQNTYPMVSEVYNFFEEIPAKTYPSSYNQIPTLPVDLKTIVPGLYKYNDSLISATRVTSQEFKYKALYTGSHLVRSCLADELSGIYLCILTKGLDGIHYEPMAFSYLLRDEFFDGKSTRYIVPFLVLPTTLPDELSFQWPYLAIRQLAKTLSPLVDYHYLASDPKEVELLKAWGVYD